MEATTAAAGRSVQSSPLLVGCSLCGTFIFNAFSKRKNQRRQEEGWDVGRGGKRVIRPPFHVQTGHARHKHKRGRETVDVD